MTSFIYADELKKRFRVFGSYYNINTVKKRTIPCRNILEICSKKIVPENSKLKPFFGKPDAIFVMMNPGSSEPREPGYFEPEIPVSEIPLKLKDNRMVIAKPDVTQYQVMRVMVLMKWDHVRVLNLSDIREPKSAKFILKVREFENDLGDLHTIFSKQRRVEAGYAMEMRSGSSPVVIGWGLGKQLLPLAGRAMEFLENYNCIGVKTEGSSNLFSHPSPNIQRSKEVWLESIFKLLKEAGL